jgi:glycosyltransferase involved in cell wall biosynthesis
LTILFLIRSLHVGGAERQLIGLAKELARRGERVGVATFYGGGILEGELKGTGIELIPLGKKGRWDVVPFLVRLVSLLRSRRPEVLYSFLPSENVVSALVKPFTRFAARVWGVRTAYFDFSGFDRVVRLAYWLEAKLSRSADLVISNSQAGVDHAVAKGFPGDRLAVVANGIDTARFRPDQPARERIRAEFGLGAEHFVVGTLGRLDPIKDMPTFLEAAAIIAEERPSARFLCVGEGPLEAGLKALADKLGLGRRIVWAGSRGDPEACFNAMDVYCSSSIAEGLSNSIAEAMASNLPCVVTDVGDSANLVGDCGVIVPPGDPEGLARAVIARIDGGGGGGWQGERALIIENFSIERMGERTLALLRALPNRGRPEAVRSLGGGAA